MPSNIITFQSIFFSMFLKKATAYGYIRGKRIK